MAKDDILNWGLGLRKSLDLGGKLKDVRSFCRQSRGYPKELTKNN